MAQGKNLKYILYSLFENPLPNVTFDLLQRKQFHLFIHSRW